MTRAQWGVAEALREALSGVSIERHLCLLPLAVLLENVAGVYAPLVRGRRVLRAAAARGRDCAALGLRSPSPALRRSSATTPTA